MTALDAVAGYQPATRCTVEQAAAELGLREMDVKLFRRFHGLAEICRDPQTSLVDLLLAAADRVGVRGHEHRIRYVLWARAFPTVVPYPVNPLHEVCRTLGLRHALAFTVSQQSCASGLLAIDLAGRLLAADADSAGPDSGEPGTARQRAARQRAASRRWPWCSPVRRPSPGTPS